VSGAPRPMPPHFVRDEVVVMDAPPHPPPTRPGKKPSIPPPRPHVIDGPPAYVANRVSVGGVSTSCAVPALGRVVGAPVPERIESAERGDALPPPDERYAMRIER
jgi:hypothetical protein